MYPIVRLLGITGLIVLFIMPAALAADDRLPPSISVSGSGRVYAKPNLAIVNIGVVTRGSTAIDASKANNNAMSMLMETVNSKGINERDTQTSNFCVSPEYQSTSNGRSKIIGYSVSNSVQVKVRKLASLGEILDAVVESGANQINGISFMVEDSSKLLDVARKEAINDARRKAQIYADASGIQLGKPIYVTEGRNVPIAPQMFALKTMSAMPSSAPVPISGGEEELSVQVNVTFAIQ